MLPGPARRISLSQVDMLKAKGELELEAVYDNESPTGDSSAEVVNPLQEGTLLEAEAATQRLSLSSRTSVTPPTSECPSRLSSARVADVEDGLWRWSREKVAACLISGFLLIIISATAALGKKSPESGGGGGGSLVIVVSPFGDDATGDGSSHKPFASISRAALGLKPGSTVLVGAGTYSLTSAVVTAVSGTQQQPISFVSVMQWGAKLSLQPSTAATAKALWLNSGSFVQISGFELSLGVTSSGIVNEGGVGVTVVSNYIHSSAGPRLDCFSYAGAAIKMHYGTGTGTGAVSGTGSGNVIAQNLVALRGLDRLCPDSGGALHGVVTNGHRDIVANNVILGAPGNGVVVDCTWGEQDPCIVSVAFNLVTNCSQSAVSIAGVASSPSLIEANSVTYNGGYAIAADSDANRREWNVRIEFNLFYGNNKDRGGVACAPVLGHGECKAKQTLGNPLLPLKEAGSLATGGASLLRLSRAFMPRCGNRTTRSPLVGGAQAVPTASSIDFLGVARPVTGPVDIGPFQSHC